MDDTIKSPWGPMIEAEADAYRRATVSLRLALTLPDDPTTERVIAALDRRLATILNTRARDPLAYSWCVHVAVLGALKAEKATLAHETNVRELAQLFAAAE